MDEIHSPKNLIHVLVHRIKENIHAQSKSEREAERAKTGVRDNSYAKVAALVPWSVARNY